MSQFTLLKKSRSAYGGELMKTREGRRVPRPIVTRETMHLVLRSSRAKREFSFRTGRNPRVIANLHFHIKLGNRFSYVKFIRAVTPAISMAITGRSRWDKISWTGKFWDYRPFTRLLQSYQEYLNLNDYIQINQWEGLSHAKANAVYFMESRSRYARYSSPTATSSGAVSEELGFCFSAVAHSIRLNHRIKIRSNQRIRNFAQREWAGVLG